MIVARKNAAPTSLHISAIKSITTQSAGGGDGSGARDQSKWLSWHGVNTIIIIIQFHLKTKACWCVETSTSLTSVLWSEKQKNNNNKVNSLTPMSPVSSHGEPWPLFHFWRHHLWLKLASSMLNFCRKRSFQWCPYQSDRLNGALNIHENAQICEWKTQSKTSCR